MEPLPHDPLLACPVCRSGQPVNLLETTDIEVSCRRCGTYAITPEAAESLLQSSAPVPDDFRLSHAFRWAAAFHDLRGVYIDTDEARRIIQRRRSRSARRASYRRLLMWLDPHRRMDQELHPDGWAAVLNASSIDDAERRVRRLERWGLVIAATGEHGRWRLKPTARAADRRERIRSRRERGEANGQDAGSIDDRDPGRALENLYASSLFVSDYGCFAGQQTISFASEDGRVSRWTFLIGENGTGKTTALKLLAGLFPVWPTQAPRPSISGEQLDYIDVFAERTTLKMHQVEAEFQQGPLGGQLADPLVAGAGARNLSLGRIGFLLQLGFDSMVVRWRSPPSFLAGYSRMPRKPLLVAYGAARTVAKSGYTGERDREGHAYTLFNPDASLQDPEDWLLRIDYASRLAPEADPSRPSPAVKLQRALLDILPEVTEITVRAPDAQHDRPWVGFHTDQGIRDYRSLSIGYQSTTAWIVDLAIRMIENHPDDADPLERPVIVLLDEIDIHLHPRWQRSITSHLERIFPRAQFIATTHSPLIIQGAVDANLVLLRKERDGVHVVNDVDEIRNFRVDQILTSELFGLASARPDEVAALFRRRVELLAQPEASVPLTELARVEEELLRLGEQPTEGLTPAARTLLESLRTGR